MVDKISNFWYKIRNHLNKSQPQELVNKARSGLMGNNQELSFKILLESILLLLVLALTAIIFIPFSIGMEIRDRIKYGIRNRRYEPSNWGRQPSEGCKHKWVKTFKPNVFKDEARFCSKCKLVERLQK